MAVVSPCFRGVLGENLGGLAVSDASDASDWLVAGWLDWLVGLVGRWSEDSGMHEQ